MKATHRYKLNPSFTYFDVSSEKDLDGQVSVKRIYGSGFRYTYVYASDIEPIPAPAPRRPFDYESWRALLKQHGGNVWVREGGSVHTSRLFNERGFSLASWERAMSVCEYSTDFGDTWHKMSRE